MLSAETSVGYYRSRPSGRWRRSPRLPRRSPRSTAVLERSRGDTVAAAVMHACRRTRGEINAAALVIPTITGGAARACSKYRRRRPIIALAHNPRSRISSRSNGASTREMDVAGSVDDMIDRALVAAEEFASSAAARAW